MANNSLSNGHAHRATVSQRMPGDRTKRAQEIAPVENRNWLLHRYYARRDYQVCKTLIERELIKSNGHNEYAYYLKGLILRKEGKVQDSLDSFQMSYNANSTNANIVKEIAKSFFVLGSHKRAIEAYLEAEKISHVADWEIYQRLGECYARLNKPQEAMKNFKRSIELTKNELPYVALARIYTEDNQMAEARKVYTAARNANPESVDVATELGLLYLRVGDIQRAFQQFGTALVHSPTSDKALLPMAYVMQTHEEYDVALSKYKIAAQSIPESPALWNNIAMCFYGKQKFIAAISCLKRAHYLNPMAYAPACNLGLVFLAIGQPASAAIYLCAALRSGPKEHLPYLLLGLALKRLEDFIGAEKALTKAHALSPQDPVVLINYAIALDHLGKEEEAVELLAALNDIAAVVDVDPQIAQTAKRLSQKLKRRNSVERNEEEERILDTDEV